MLVSTVGAGDPQSVGISANWTTSHRLHGGFRVGYMESAENCLHRHCHSWLRVSHDAGNLETSTRTWAADCMRPRQASAYPTL